MQKSEKEWAKNMRKSQKEQARASTKRDKASQTRNKQCRQLDKMHRLTWSISNKKRRGTKTIRKKVNTVISAD